MLCLDLDAAIGELTVTDAFYQLRMFRHPHLVLVVMRLHVGVGCSEASLLTLGYDASSSAIHLHVAFCYCRLNAVAFAFSPSPSQSLSCFSLTDVSPHHILLLLPKCQVFRRSKTCTKFVIATRYMSQARRYLPYVTSALHALAIYARGMSSFATKQYLGRTKPSLRLHTITRPCHRRLTQISRKLNDQGDYPAWLHDISAS